MQTSEQINELAAALSKAQGEMGFAKKDSANPFFKSKYANLAEVREALRGPLANNGLAVCQPLSVREDAVVVTTILMHASGQWISEELTIPLAKHDAQGIGSAGTYGLRYGLQAITGMAPDDASDDDGNAAQNPLPRQQVSKKKADKPAEQPMTDDERQYIVDTEARLNKCDDEEGMQVIASEIAQSGWPKHVKDRLRGFYAAKLAIVKTRSTDATSQPEPASAE